MAKKKATEPTEDAPAEDAPPEPPDLETQMRQMAEYQRQTQEAYVDGQPPEPSL